MILDVDKPSGPGPAAELVEFAGGQDRDLLIGVGGDSTERGVDHRAFAPVFARPASSVCTAPSTPGRTARPTTSPPRSTISASNGSTTASGCSTTPSSPGASPTPRIPLTVCPISNVVIANVIDDVAQHPFARQREAGVLVTVNSDDPGMMGTTICDDYQAVADRFDYELTTVEDIALDAIDASWAPSDEQAALRTRFLVEMDALRAANGLAPRG